MQPLDVPTAATTKFDLTLHLVEDARAASTATVEYNTDLFDAATIERLAGALRARCCERSSPTRAGRLARCRCCRRPSAHQLLASWNATDAPPGDPQTAAARLFEAQAARTPDADGASRLEGATR